jgi:hypothetical protein
MLLLVLLVDMLLTQLKVQLALDQLVKLKLLLGSVASFSVSTPGYAPVPSVASFLALCHMYSPGYSVYFPSTPILSINVINVMRYVFVCQKYTHFMYLSLSI